VALCLLLRFRSRTVSSITRSAFGWPTRSRALALTAFTAENVFFFVRFFAIPKVENQRNTFPQGLLSIQ
jgi:hypothetical protein